MKRLLKYLIIAALCLASCSEDRFSPAPEQQCVTVGFFAGGCADADIRLDTRTVSGPDGLSTQWQDSDSMALWATDRSGRRVLEECIFRSYGISTDGAFFTADLDSPMPEGVYTYVACYPVPERVQGDKLYFTVPAEQDGTCSGGADVMISDKAGSGALASVDWQSGVRDFLHLEMHHLTHRLRFECRSSDFGGEQVRRIVAVFPGPVTGEIETVLGKQTANIVRNGRNTVEIKNIGGAETINAQIVPVSFRQGDVLTVKAYTDSKLAICKIPLNGRNFAAGHSTPVKVTPATISTYNSLILSLASNNLGEDPQTITIEAPLGCSLGNGSRSVTLEYGADIVPGGKTELGFEDTGEFLALSGRTLTITYDSPHATVTQEIIVPDLSGTNSQEILLDIPYLLEEDFSTVRTFSSYDQYAISSAGSKDAVRFLDGWTGGRIGAQEGTSIRIACRRETSADYDARVDSAPVQGVLKQGAVLRVEFDYGSAEEHGGILSRAVGQNCYVGYTTSEQAYKSGSTSGKFDRTLNTFYTAAADGSYTNTPEHAEMILPIDGTPDIVRICIRTEIEHIAGMNNSTDWLYIDNVRISLYNE